MFKEETSNFVDKEEHGVSEEAKNLPNVGIESLGRNYYISDKYCKTITSKEGTEQQIIDWKSIPRFEKKPTLDYFYILKEMEEFVKELDKMCCLEFSSSTMEQYSANIEKVLKGLERIIKTKNEYFNLNPSYKKGDLERKFNNLILILTSLNDITKDYLTERMKSELIVSKYGEMANKVNHVESLQESKHFQLISNILQDQVLSLQSKIIQYEEIKKTQLEPNIKVLQRVDKYSL